MWYALEVQLGQEVHSRPVNQYTFSTINHWFWVTTAITDYNSLSFYRLSSQTTDVLRSPISPQDETGLSFLSLNETNRVKCEVYKHNWKGKNIKCNFSWIRNDNLFNNNFLNNMLLNATHIKLCISEFIQINIKIYIKN